jgi:hypothetical protein
MTRGDVMKAAIIAAASKTPVYGDFIEPVVRAGEKSGEACAGMPETRYGANSHRPVD